MPNHRNILFICTDQQQGRAIGAIDESFDTPHLDRLADGGALFTGCHSTHPQCSPARSSLVTGLYPHQTGMYTLPEWGPGPLNPALPSVARPFREAGYDTAYIGKWHLGDGTVTDFGWETTANVHETSNPPAGTPADTTTRDLTVEYLDAHDGAEPFFLTASFNLPHPEFYEDIGFADRYEREAVPLPETWNDTLDDKPAFHRERAAETTGTMTEEDLRAMRYRYRTMVSRVDDHIGRILDALQQNDLRNETAVVVTSDHGDMQGAHRLAKKGVIAYDEILRVPLIVDIPRQEPDRDRIPDLCSIASVPSTLLDAAGLSPAGVGSTSLLPSLDRTAPPDDEAVFFEHKYAYWGEHPYRGVRTRDWKLVENLTDNVNELYHVSEDPYEMENLAGDPTHGDIAANLSERLTCWWERTEGNIDEWTRPMDRSPR